MNCIELVLTRLHLERFIPSGIQEYIVDKPSDVQIQGIVQLLCADISMDCDGVAHRFPATTRNDTRFLEAQSIYEKLYHERENAVLFVLIYENKNLIAFGDACHSPCKQSRVELGVYVTPKARRRNIARHILFLLYKGCTERGYTEAVAEIDSTNTPMQNLADLARSIVDLAQAGKPMAYKNFSIPLQSIFIQDFERIGAKIKRKPRE